jgi:hypothetical protein
MTKKTLVTDKELGKDATTRLAAICGRGGAHLAPQRDARYFIPFSTRRARSGRRSPIYGAVLPSDPGRRVDAAWAAADVLRIPARALRDPVLHRAAETYDRAARTPYGRIPRCTYAGARLQFLAQ